MGHNVEKPVWTVEELSEQVQNLKSETEVSVPTRIIFVLVSSDS